MSGLEMSEAGMYQCFCYNTMQISQTYMPVSVKSKFSRFITQRSTVAVKLYFNFPMNKGLKNVSLSSSCSSHKVTLA